MRSSLNYLRPYKKQLALGVLMLALTNVFYLGVPEMLGRSVDALGIEGSSVIGTFVLWMVVFSLLTAVTRIASRILIFNSGRAAEYDLRSELFGHVMTLSPGYYRDHPTGDVMSRLTNDVQTVRAMWGAGAVHLVNALTSFATVLTWMVWRDWRVALLSILPYPLIFFVGQALSRRVYRTQREVQAELGALSARIQEDLGAIQVIKTYGLED